MSDLLFDERGMRTRRVMLPCTPDEHATLVRAARDGKTTVAGVLRAAVRQYCRTDGG